MATGGVGDLRRNELGFAEVLFQGLASAAPGLSVTLAVVVGASFGGRCAPPVRATAAEPAVPA